MKIKLSIDANTLFEEIIEDIGWFQDGQFLTFDEIGIYPITHWKYF